MKIQDLFEARDSKVGIGALIKRLWTPIVKKYQAMDEMKGFHFTTTMSGDYVVNLDILKPYENEPFDISTLHPNPEIAKKLAAKIQAKNPQEAEKEKRWIKIAQLRKQAMKEITEEIIKNYPEVTTVGLSSNVRGTKYTYVDINKIDFDSLEWGKNSNVRFKFKWDPDQKPNVIKNPALVAAKLAMQAFKQSPLFKKYEGIFYPRYSYGATVSPIAINQQWAEDKLRKFYDRKNETILYKGKEFKVNIIEDFRNFDFHAVDTVGIDSMGYLKFSFPLIHKILEPELTEIFNEIAAAGSTDEFQIRFKRNKSGYEFGQFILKARKK